eukprot:SAG11_NODE_36198_length_263_cov_0.164634_1_plen_52_part_10
MEGGQGIGEGRAPEFRGLCVGGGEGVIDMAENRSIAAFHMRKSSHHLQPRAA